MSMYFINTDKKSNAGESYHDEWFSRGVAVTSGPDTYKTRLDRPEIGDLFLMYVNGTGIVGIGKVLSIESVSTNDTTCPNEPHEYHREVDWYLDLRESPVSPATIREMAGQTPLQTVQMVHKGEEVLYKFLENL